MLFILFRPYNKWKFNQGVGAEDALFLHRFALFHRAPRLVQVRVVVVLVSSSTLFFAFDFVDRKLESELYLFFLAVHVNLVKALLYQFLFDLHTIDLGLSLSILHVFNNIFKELCIVELTESVDCVG